MPASLLEPWTPIGSKPYAGLLQQLSSARTGEASVFERTLVESSVYHLAGSSGRICNLKPQNARGFAETSCEPHPCVPPSRRTRTANNLLYK